MLRIPVLEAVSHLFGAEDDHADCNYLVGTLTIEGSDTRVTRDLPQGSEVDVTIIENESREIHARAYVPLLDEDFEATFKSGSFDVSTAQIAKRLDDLQHTFAKIEKLQEEKPLGEAGEKIDKIRHLRVLDEIAKDIDRAKAGENDACYRAYTRLLEVAGAINLISVLQRPARIQQRIEQLDGVVESDEVKVLDGIRGEYTAASRCNNTAELEALEGGLDALDAKVRQRPIWQLFLDWQAFPQRFRGTQDQLQAFKNVEELCEEIAKTEKSGGVASQSQIQRAKQAHEHLMNKWPELPGWIQEYIAQPRL